MWLLSFRSPAGFRKARDAQWKYSGFAVDRGFLILYRNRGSFRSVIQSENRLLIGRIFSECAAQYGKAGIEAVRSYLPFIELPRDVGIYDSGVDNFEQVDWTLRLQEMFQDAIAEQLIDGLLNFDCRVGPNILVLAAAAFARIATAPFLANGV